MTYDKYIKYKVKYMKLKELEKKLIESGQLPPDYMNQINNKQLGGSMSNKMCKNCYKINNTKHKFCNSCNKNNIYKISKLTDTPKMMDIYGFEYDIHQTLYNKLQPIQEGGSNDDDLISSENDLYSHEERKIDLKPEQDKINISTLSNKNQLFENIHNELTESESVALSILNSDDI
jgi:hypothetical protein